MSFIDETYCQLCERFITEEEWKNHLFSSRPSHREVIGFWPTFFPQRKLTADECKILEKAY